MLFKVNYAHTFRSSCVISNDRIVLNFAARAVTKTSKFHHIMTPILKSFHWLEEMRVQYKDFSFTFISPIGQPSDLQSLLSCTPT